MDKRHIFRMICLLFCLGAMIFAPLNDVFARSTQRGIHNVQSTHRQDFSRHQASYRYHDGRFYRPSFFGLFEIAIAIPPIGAVLTVLPGGHRTMIVGSTTYYYHNNVYYKDYSSGYLVVPAPAITPVAVVATSTRVKSAPQETITVNIPNTNGSYTAIDLIKQGNGYLGPQGEYYPSHPTVSQLRVLYGR